MKPCGHTTDVGDHCQYCLLNRTRKDYRDRWAAQPATQAIAKLQPCVHLDLEEIRKETCQTCRGNVAIKVYPCAEFGECTLGIPVEGVKGCCAGGKCPKYSAKQPS